MKEMAKVHDKYVVELAEIIKGYGNDPDINDPFCLSEFYRFYEVPNICVSAENFKKMRPLSDYTEEIEPETISKWKKEFRKSVDSLDITRDDWKGIIEYIDELPPIQSERKTGHWVYRPEWSKCGDVWSCSECGEKTSQSVMREPRFKYCPMCGAKMESGGEQDG